MRKLKAPYRFSLSIKECFYHCFKRGSVVRHSFVNLFRRLVKKDFKVLLLTGGIRGDAVGWDTALKAGRSRVRFPMVSLEFFIDIILPAALCPWGWLNLLQKWVPGTFPGVKGGRCIGLTTLPASCADCLEICEPQPPAIVRACPGLYRDRFTFTFIIDRDVSVDRRHIASSYVLLMVIDKYFRLVSSFVVKISNKFQGWICDSWGRLSNFSTWPKKEREGVICNAGRHFVS